MRDDISMVDVDYILNNPPSVWGLTQHNYDIILDYITNKDSMAKTATRHGISSTRMLQLRNSLLHDIELRKKFNIQRCEHISMSTIRRLYRAGICTEAVLLKCLEDTPAECIPGIGASTADEIIGCLVKDGL